MSARKLVERLSAYRKVAVDAGPFQLFFQGDAATERLTLALFELIEQGRLEAVSSVVTLTELLIGPYQRREEDLVKELNFLLPTFPHLTLVPISHAIADRAAFYQARHRLAPGTSFQAATADAERADCLVTTDATLVKVVAGMDVLVLQDCL